MHLIPELQLVKSGHTACSASNITQPAHLRRPRIGYTPRLRRLQAAPPSSRMWLTGKSASYTKPNLYQRFPASSNSFFESVNERARPCLRGVGLLPQSHDPYTCSVASLILVPSTVIAGFSDRVFQIRRVLDSRPRVTPN